jgi:hypothetical protein
MAAWHDSEATGAGETEDRTPLTAEQLEASPEFRKFKNPMHKILKVSKPDLDRRVQTANETSPPFGNPNAAGQKRLNANTERKG